ncbi:BTAD domain-containing putative transcriptional regulator [Actinoplanes sp. NPDC049668]|uniref:AfsR/SARP family transcriptional regulator n=1 Tax=unclassified Actinoplanes TaxID=2626549 RepID=UPI0033A06BF7
MRFRVLGPLEVWDGDRQVPLGGPQQHAVLAVLLVHAGQVVSVDRLAGQLWNHDPPPTARSLIQGCVAGLRRALRTGTAELITRSPGYLLRPGDGAVDAVRFEELAAAAAAAESPGRSAALFREALELWRGSAFDGLGPEACRAESVRLAERRMTVLEQRIDADLADGRAADLVAELRTVIAEHPYRERLWAQLMTALHRSDQRAAALDAYRKVRGLLVDGLGVEPGPTLRELHRAILSEADPPARPAGGPAQLPPAVSSFSGRAEQLDRLDELLGRPGPAVPIGMVCGSAGVGKTALAVHWAHRARSRFPDGQLYVNLRGYATSAPLRPIEALAGFLQALGVPADQVPPDAQHAAAMYRTLLADRRLLVVLDNARSADQVRPLLPGGSACVVLITSRDGLGGLVAQDGAAHLRLGVLTAPEAANLLELVLGARARAEAGAAAELARRCAYLPLALRIAAAHLTLHPRRTVAGYLDRFGLDELAADDATVRVAFDLSYAGLDGPARRLFRRLGLAPGADVTVGDAAALGDLDPGVAARLLDRLACAHLIEEARPGRFAFHDLLRQYAAEHNPPADRDAALARLYRRYVGLARSAAALLYPHMLLLPHLEPEGTHAHPDADAALAWLETERANLVQAVQAAARGGPRRDGWVLADALRGAFHLSRHTTGWLTMAEAALAAATADGDPAGQAAAQQSLGTARRSTGAYADALRHYTEALRLARECGWAESEATNLGNLGIACRKLGRLSEAAGHLRSALAVDRRIGRGSGEANNLGNLAAVYHAMGRLPDAAAAYRAALRSNAEAGIVHGEALARTGLGQVGIELGRHDEARDHLDQALELYRRVGDRDGESVVRSVLATVECALGRPEAARRQAAAALAGAREVGDPQSEAMALNALGRAARLLSDADRAIADHHAAYRVAHRTADRCEEAEALIGLADAHRRAGRTGDATGYALRARALAERGGLGLVAGRATATLAVIRGGTNGT